MHNWLGVWGWTPLKECNAIKYFYSTTHVGSTLNRHQCLEEQTGKSEGVSGTGKVR